jgi:long-chain acyl-CoA synthetase
MTGTPPYDPIVIAGCDTVPKLFRLRVRQLGQKVALREKKFGIWESTTWQQYGEKAKEIGMGLLALGLQRGDVCSVLSENNKEWFFTDMGILCCGGVTNGIYTTDSAKQLEYLLNDSQSRFLFLENEEQLDKFLEIKERVPRLEKVIVFDPEGLHEFHDPAVIMLPEFCELGRRFAESHSTAWDQNIDMANPQDLMVLIYTSGTTGPPKGAMVSHLNCMFGMHTFARLMPSDEKDEQLSFLPLCHIAERMFSILMPLTSCATINFAESTATVPENIREISPTIFFSVPRIWEKFYSAIALQVKDTTRFGKWGFQLAFKIGNKAASYKLAKRPRPFIIGIVYWLAKLTVLNNIKRMLGLDRARWVLTGAAPISPDLVRWYYALGINMLEVFGQTESSGLATTNTVGDVKLSTIGKAIPDTEVKLSSEGEILIKGPNVFLGYLNQPEKTKETVIDGWLYTGDVGVKDQDGFFTITDRMKDIIITAGGKNISPSEIENQLKFSPYITDAVVIGDKRKYLSCLIMIDQENVEKFAQDNDVPYTNYASLCHSKEVYELIWNEVLKVNKNLARVESVKKIKLIDQLLTAEDDELTPTMKLKRKFVNQKYKDLIDSMY